MTRISWREAVYEDSNHATRLTGCQTLPQYVVEAKKLLSFRAVPSLLRLHKAADGTLYWKSTGNRKEKR